MSHARSARAFVAFLIVAIFAVNPALADDTTPDAALDLIRYRAPAGWQATDRPGQAARVFSAPDSNAAQQAIIILIVTPPKENFDLAADLDAAVKEVTANGKVLESTDPATTKTRQGFDAISRTLVTQAPAGGDQRVYARMIAAKVGNRMAGIYYLATTQELYDKYQATMGNLLQSVSFEAVGAAAAAPAIAGARAELEALEKQKQELLAKVAEIEARQRQLAGGAPAGAAAGVAAAARPAAAGEAALGDNPRLLAAAREQFARNAPARRKPHTVLGDIRRLDGSPIPNVVSYHVTVWGTTVAAERSTYNLDVDKDGHFEQLVPDGLYKVNAICVVDNAGHRVPVDLAWLDDKEGVSQSSTGGIVRDFRLITTGLRPGADPKRPESYFGATLRVTGPNYDVQRGQLSTRHPGGRVRVTLTPLGPLVDGTRGETIVREMDASDANYGGYARGIPPAAYRVTAAVVERDGSTRPLGCATTFNGPFMTAADVFWEAAHDNTDVRTEPTIFVQD
jgi:hypothetical protein